MIDAGDSVRYDMSDLQPTEFGATTGQGIWGILIDFLQNPDDVDGTAAGAGELGERRPTGTDGGSWRHRPPRHRSAGREERCCCSSAPALVLLGAIVVYPIFFSVGRSFFDANGSQFVGVDNYQEMFTSDATRTAIKNNLIWVVFAPSIVTALGLIFAVLTERVAWSTAFKVAIFMPMAISFLSAGVTWRLIYEQDPEIGLANATVGAVVDVVRPPGVLPGARPSQDEQELEPTADGAVQLAGSVAPGDTATARPGGDPSRSRCPPTPCRRSMPRAPRAASPAPSGWTSRPAAAARPGVIEPEREGTPRRRRGGGLGR